MDIAVYGDVHIHTAETKKEVNLHTIRCSNAVTNAKTEVKGRDGVCKCCGEYNEIMEVHHIFPLSKYPELASDTGNMITLCQSCHARYHNRYDIDDVNPVSFVEFMVNNAKKEDWKLPTKLEAELRAVQTSIAEVKRQMKETCNVEHHEKMRKALKMYYDEEERLLNEINRDGGI